jgi:hypothetical protein
MIDEVVDLVVAVHERGSVLGLEALVREEVDHTLKVRDIAHRLIGLHVFCRCLRRRDGLEGFDLSVVELRMLAVVRQSNRLGVDAVKLGQRSNGIVPPANLLFRHLSPFC